jgi:hypothetical protein
MNKIAAESVQRTKTGDAPRSCGRTSPPLWKYAVKGRQ